MLVYYLSNICRKYWQSWGSGQYPKATGIGVLKRAKLSTSKHQVIVVLLLIHPLELSLIVKSEYTICVMIKFTSRDFWAILAF